MLLYWCALLGLVDLLCGKSTCELHLGVCGQHRAEESSWKARHRFAAGSIPTTSGAAICGTGPSWWALELRRELRKKPQGGCLLPRPIHTFRHMEHFLMCVNQPLQSVAVDAVCRSHAM